MLSFMGSVSSQICLPENIDILTNETTFRVGHNGGYIYSNKVAVYYASNYPSGKGIVRSKNKYKIINYRFMDIEIYNNKSYSGSVSFQIGNTVLSIPINGSENYEHQIATVDINSVSEFGVISFVHNSSSHGIFSPEIFRIRLYN